VPTTTAPPISPTSPLKALRTVLTNPKSLSPSAFAPPFSSSTKRACRWVEEPVRGYDRPGGLSHQIRHHSPNAGTKLDSGRPPDLRKVFHPGELAEVRQLDGPVAVHQRDVVLHGFPHHRIQESRGARFRPDGGYTAAHAIARRDYLAAGDKKAQLAIRGRSSLASVAVPSGNGNSTVAPVAVRMCTRTRALFGSPASDGAAAPQWAN